MAFLASLQREGRVRGVKDNRKCNQIFLIGLLALYNKKDEKKDQELETNMSPMVVRQKSRRA